ncbi:MAG: DUF1799 domain-containing protein [Halorhodospira sp.]
MDQREATEESYEVWPENQEAYVLFQRCLTQWRVGQDQAIGLDYTGVEAVLRILEVEDWQDAFDRLQVMEHAALSAMREKKS